MQVLEEESVADLIARLGVPPERIRLKPPPGTATEEDVLRVQPLCELVDGVLVERAMGWYESRLGALLIHYLEDFLELHDLGMVLGADGMMRVHPREVRIPDVAFYSWEQFPDRLLPSESILNAVPDLAVEILSPGNTKAEMQRKRREYFAGGARSVWTVEPEKRCVEVFTAPEQSFLIEETQELDGGEVLPGFTLSVAAWFARAGQRR